MNFYGCYTIIPFSAKEQDAVQSNTATRTQYGLEGPPEKKYSTTEAQNSTIDKWSPRAAQPKKEKFGGPSGVAGLPPWSVDQPMGPTAFRLHVAAPHWLLMSVQGGMGLILGRGEGGSPL